MVRTATFSEGDRVLLPPPLFIGYVVSDDGDEIIVSADGHGPQEYWVDERHIELIEEGSDG